MNKATETFYLIRLGILDYKIEQIEINVTLNEIRGKGKELDYYSKKLDNLKTKRINLENKLQ